MRKERFIQFGSGGFLRGFVDWMIQKMNDTANFDSNVIVVQSFGHGFGDTLKEQDYKYTHIMRGEEGVESSVIDVISKCVEISKNFEEYLRLAEHTDVKFIISNTTEAGIEFKSTDKISDTIKISFPAKLTLLLKRRFDLGLKGYIFLPCELIERNGDKLKEAILSYADLWGYSNEFKKWINEENVFTNTLVDRINTGYPKDEDIDVGFSDKLLNTSEHFHLWVIETDYDLESDIPFKKAGLNVIITKNELEKYRTIKVRILNGAHTSMVAHGLLSGFDTVKSCVDDENMRKFIEKCIFDEIIPTLDMPQNELYAYANDVIKRFSNPYIKHYLSSISLNSISKFKVRVLPSIIEYKNRFGKYPENLTYALFRLIEFYKTSTPNDNESIIDFIKTHSTAEILRNVDLWGKDISDILDEVEKI